MVVNLPMAQSCSSPVQSFLIMQAGLVSSGHMSEPVSRGIEYGITRDKGTHMLMPPSLCYSIPSRGAICSFSTRPRMSGQVHADVAGTGLGALSGIMDVGCICFRSTHYFKIHHHAKFKTSLSVRRHVRTSLIFPRNFAGRQFF